MKKILAILLISTLCLTLTGCESKQKTGEAAKKISLQVWAVSGPEADVIAAQGREFVSRMKNPLLSLKVVGFSSEKELQEFLVDKMAEGKGPDVVYTSGNWIARNRAKLISLGEKDEHFTAQKFTDTFVRGATDALVNNNQVWGMPLGIDSLALIFNEDHMVNALSDRNHPSDTWEGFRTDVTTLNRKDNSFERFTISGGAIGRMDNIRYAFSALENIMVQMGVHFFSASGKSSTIARSTGISRLGKRENFATEALKYFSSFANEKFKNYSWNEHMADPFSAHKDLTTFVQGKTSMVFGFSGDLKRIDELAEKRRKFGERVVPKDSIRVAFLPQIEDPDSSHTREVVAHVKALAVPRTTKNQKTAWNFLKFMVEKDQLRSFFNETKLPTPRLSLVPEQESEPGIGIYVRQAKFARPNLTPLPTKLVANGLKKIVAQIHDGKTYLLPSLQALEGELTAILQERERHNNALVSSKPKEKMKEEKKESSGFGKTKKMKW